MSEYAVIHVREGANQSWPIVERVSGGWQSGAHHYPDEIVLSVRRLELVPELAQEIGLPANAPWANVRSCVLQLWDRAGEANKLNDTLTELVALEDESHPFCPDAESCARWQDDYRARNNAAWARARAALAAVEDLEGRR